MVAPHTHTTDESKADIRRISNNRGPGDNEGPVTISKGHGSHSGSVMTTSTHNVEPKHTDGDVVSKRKL